MIVIVWGKGACSGAQAVQVKPLLRPGLENNRVHKIFRLLKERKGLLDGGLGSGLAALSQGGRKENGCLQGCRRALTEGDLRNSCGSCTAITFSRPD